MIKIVLILKPSLCARTRARACVSIIVSKQKKNLIYFEWTIFSFLFIWIPNTIFYFGTKSFANKAGKSNEEKKTSFVHSSKKYSIYCGLYQGTVKKKDKKNTHRNQTIISKHWLSTMSTSSDLQYLIMNHCNISRKRYFYI